MTLKHNIKIVKVPLPSSEKNINRPQVFPRMPRLYLELLENKSKIKQDLINKEYSPKKSISNKDINLESKLDKFLNDEKNVIEEKNNNVKEEDEKFQDDDDTDYKEKKRKERKDKKNKDQESDQEFVQDDSKIKDEEIENKDDETVSINSKKSEEEDNKEEDNKDENESEYENKKDKYDNDDTDSDMESKASSVDNLSVRLNNLLNDKNDDNNSVRTDKSKNKYSRRRDYEENVSVSTKQNRTKNIAPSLAELESQGGYVRKQTLRDINNIPYNDQEEEDLKREIMFKIELLKKSYPNSSIPEFSIHSDYKSMKKTYDDTVRRLSLDSTVESYKTYLIGGFMACEFVLGNFFKLEMTGFTQQQILSMNNYEKLLIELGEKSYVPTGSKWPVEVRLLFMIIMNAGFFVVSKMIMKKTGANLLGMINGMNVQTQGQQTKKRKMKGPEIDVNDIPEE
jgi:hypothetical protein